MLCLDKSTSSPSPASLSSSLCESKLMLPDVSTSLAESCVDNVSPASDGNSPYSTSDPPSISEAPLTPVSDAAEEDVSDFSFLRFTVPPGGAGLLHTGKAGASVAITLIVITGLSLMLSNAPRITAMAFFTSSSSDILILPNLTPTQEPFGSLNGVPFIAFSKFGLGFDATKRTGMGTLCFLSKKTVPRSFFITFTTDVSHKNKS
mmetsp:Transcript_42261/g.122155  ORF Transcript_42261/g.122155 Transcript_42261/m.122155 type:complete len:205 (-) Transcript_42261:427-1041(-)